MDGLVSRVDGALAGTDTAGSHTWEMARIGGWARRKVTQKCGDKNIDRRMRSDAETGSGQGLRSGVEAINRKRRLGRNKIAVTIEASSYA